MPVRLFLQGHQRTRRAMPAALGAKSACAFAVTILVAGAVACTSAKPHASHASPMAPAPSAPSLVGSQVNTSPPVSEGSQRPLANGPIGTDHPIGVEGAAADASWVAICQARDDTNRDGEISVTVESDGRLSGDELHSYLVVGSGDGQPIDELMAFDPNGRFVAVKHEGRVLLLDAWRGSNIDLSARGADGRSDASPYRSHRAVAFDSAGKRMLYVRRRDGKTDVVVLDLVLGSELVIDPGPGELWRAEFDPTGNWLIFQVVGADTNQNGKIEWPSPPAAEKRARCSPPVPRYPAWPARGDSPELRFAPTTGGAARTAPGLVSIMPDALLLREPTGRLVLERAGGDSRSVTRFELAPAQCDARVLHASAAYGLFIIACKGTGSRSPVELVGVGYRNNLGFDVATTDMLRPSESSPLLVPLYPGQNSVLVDLRERRLQILDRADSVVSTHQARALIRRGKTLIFYDATTRTLTELAAGVADLPDIIVQGSTVFVTPFGVDVAIGKVLGHTALRMRPLALARDGRVLGSAAEASMQKFSRGPLNWHQLQP